MIDKIKSILASLKKAKSLHHAIMPLVLGTIGALINPVVCIALSMFSIGNYFGREQDQAEHRGFDLFDRSTWKIDYFEVSDFVTPTIVSSVFIIVSVFNLIGEA